MGYLDKINVSGTNYDLGAKLEHITDDSGNNRFIEGDIEFPELTGIASNYSHWALSGTHLMIVVTFYSGVSQPSFPSGNLCEIELPNWVISKIYPIKEGQTIVSVSNMLCVGNSGVTSYPFNLIKDSGKIYVNLSSALTITDNNYASGRLQFDLLIDNAEL